MSPFIDSESGDTAFVRLYQAHQEKMRPILDSLKQLHATPPFRVDYSTLAHTAYHTFGINLRELSGDEWRHLLYLLSREYGRLELDVTSFELAGLHPLELADVLRASMHQAPPAPPPPPSIATIQKPARQKTRPPGLAPDTVSHQAVADIVTRHAREWREDPGCWKLPAALKDICAALDVAGESADSPLLEIPPDWRTGRRGCLEGICLKGWSDALELGYKRMVTDWIGYRLKMVLRRERASAT